MAYASVVLESAERWDEPPKVAVLVSGLKLPVYDSDGAFIAEQFSSNPAWVVLDTLRRSGWGLDEIDVTSFARAAAYCDAPIAAVDLYGNAIMLPRFACNLVLQKRRAAGDVVRGVRNSARLLLTYGGAGKLELRMENSLALERPTKPAWSNAPEVVEGGWPSYEFGDGSNGISGILRNANSEPSVRLYSRSMADTPNRLTVEFQDSLNEYQQDSFSLVDPDDVARSGQEVASPVQAMGIANFDQASRIVKLNLDKSLRGNIYKFDTSEVPGDSTGRPDGDVPQRGFVRQPFRVLKMAPGTIIGSRNSRHRFMRIRGGQQWADDGWGGRRQGSAGRSSTLGDQLDGQWRRSVWRSEPATTAPTGRRRRACR